MFSLFTKLHNLTCIDLYVTTKDTPTQTYAQSPQIFTSSWNLDGMDEYLDETMNLESSFEEKIFPSYLIIKFIISCFVLFMCVVCFCITMCLQRVVSSL